MEKLKEILANSGFEIQEMSFSYLTKTSPLSYLAHARLPDNNAANIIKHYPDLFVIHKAHRPRDGSFFIIFNAGKPLSEKAKNIYNNFFPDKIAIVSKNIQNQYFAKWLWTSERPDPIGVFIDKI